MKNFKYLIVLPVAFFLLNAGSLFSEECCGKSYCEAPKAQPSCACFCNSCYDDSDLFQKDLCVFFINGEFIYWSVEQGAMDYALEMKHPAWGPSDNYAQGDYKNAQYDWKPGFKVSVGYFNAPKYWEILGQYTWLKSSGSDSATKPAADNLYLNPTWPTITDNDIIKASSDLSLNYHVGDLMVDRVFITNPHLKLRLMAALVTSYIKQKWTVKYEDSENNIADMKNKWRFFGGGLRAGLLMDWFWGCDFYLTGKVSLATLIGRYKNSAYQKTTYEPDGYDASLPYRDARYKDYRFANNIQFLLGPSWQKAFNCMRAEIFVGYEFNSWFNLNELYRSSDRGPNTHHQTYINRGLLALHGLTTRLTFNF